MNPYLSADMPAAHVADLLREAAARTASAPRCRPVPSADVGLLPRMRVRGS
jgi:hypothetical protein